MLSHLSLRRVSILLALGLVTILPLIGFVFLFILGLTVGSLPSTLVSLGFLLGFFVILNCWMSLARSKKLSLSGMVSYVRSDFLQSAKLFGLGVVLVLCAFMLNFFASSLVVSLVLVLSSIVVWYFFVSDSYTTVMLLVVGSIIIAYFGVNSSLSLLPSVLFVVSSIVLSRIHISFAFLSVLAFSGIGYVLFFPTVLYVAFVISTPVSKR